ncbi:GNAT family N-acetyltransferase [Ureibacillus sp. FSL W8-0352]|uniref:GNAT family N-acetyltransferase n=1 Tax=Ureibacillus sp. FSL W8-0352 TaxID=2954596 RepID=UPI0030F77939
MENLLLENDVVLLKPIELKDMEGIVEAAKDDRIWEHMQVNLTSREAVEQYVRNAIAARNNQISYVFVIMDKKTNQIVGCTSILDISLEHKRLEIGGTWLTPSVWRTSINTNCKYLLLTYCFEHLQLNRVQLKTAHTNKRSQTAIERIDAMKEGVLRNHMILPNGTIRHTVMYSITKEEWPAVKNRFIKELL